MKIESVHIHNFRSIVDQTVDLRDYSLLVGANNAGKSTVINALSFFFGKEKVDESDSHCGKKGDIWVKCSYRLEDSEIKSLPPGYEAKDGRLVIKKNLHPLEKKPAHIPLGKLIYIPASSAAEDHLKLSGPSDFRALLTNLIGTVSEKDADYKLIGEALTKFSDSASQAGGMLHRIFEPLNKELKSWQVKVGMKVRPLTPEEICKMLISFSFTDENVAGEVDLNKFGHGLQRTVIYETIRLISQLHSENEKASEYKLILFEEPENFLHPHQQEILAYSLRKLGEMPNQQVLITSHSPIFPGRANDDLKRIIRLSKKKAVTHVHQLTEKTYEELLSDGLALPKQLEAYLATHQVDNALRKKVQDLIPTSKEEVQQQEEEFRYQLALDGERCSMFFAEHVIMVEGATEKALLEALLRDYWTDIQNRRLYVLDMLGKYNCHRYMALFEKIGMSHSVLIDDDKNANEHMIINKFIGSCANSLTSGKGVHFIEKDMETFLGLPKPKSHRKPLEMLKALYENKIAPAKLIELKALFEKNLLPPLPL